MSYTPHLPEDDEAWTARMRTLHPQGAPEPRPFLITRLEASLEARLEARLDAQTLAPAALPAWLRRPAYAFSLGALVLAVNVGAAVHYVREQRVAAAPPPAPDGYAAFVAEYKLDPFHITSHE